MIPKELPNTSVIKKEDEDGWIDLQGKQSTKKKKSKDSKLLGNIRGTIKFLTTIKIKGYNFNNEWLNKSVNSSFDKLSKYIYTIDRNNLLPKQVLELDKLVEEYNKLLILYKRKK